MTKWLVTDPGDEAGRGRYGAWVRAAGAAPVWACAGAVPAQAPREFAALLLSGGNDVDPRRFGETARHPRTRGLDPARDELELGLIRDFRAAGRPVFGICRGLQMLWIHFGGRLIQHLPDELDEAAERHRRQHGRDALHGVRWVEGSRLAAALRSASTVNSSHHQAADPASPAAVLAVAAWSPAGVIEAVESAAAGPPVLAVQWHPERLPGAHPAGKDLALFLARLASGGSA